MFALEPLIGVCIDRSGLTYAWRSSAESTVFERRLDLTSEALEAALNTGETDTPCPDGPERVLREVLAEIEARAGARPLHLAIAHPGDMDAVGLACLRDASAAVGMPSPMLIPSSRAALLSAPDERARLGDAPIVVEAFDACASLTRLRCDRLREVAASRTDTVPLSAARLDEARTLDDLSAAERASVDDAVRSIGTLLRASGAEHPGPASVLLTGRPAWVAVLADALRRESPASLVVIEHPGTHAAMGALRALESNVSSLQGDSMSDPDHRGSDPQTSTPPTAEAERTGIPPESAERVREIMAKLEAAASRSITLLLAGRCGVGKSSTANSLLGWKAAAVNAFERQTTHATVYRHTMNGVPLHIVDTPGLCDDEPGQGRDLAYLEDMRKTAGQVDVVWFVTPLDDSRVRADECRTIRLLTQSFSADLWKHAVIVFTFADRLGVEDYKDALGVRAKLIRREIAKHAGVEIAEAVPAVAVTNSSDATPDGAEWKAALYEHTMLTISREGLLPFALGTRSLLASEVVGGESGVPAGRERDSAQIRLNPEQTARIAERIHREGFDGLVATSTAAGAVVGAAAGAVGGPIGVAIGIAVGGFIGNTIGRGLRALTGLFG